jgi:ribose-phosphate pyrophosphokinase
MEIKKYPDGSSYVKVTSEECDKDIVFKINTYEDLWHLNQYVDAYYSQHKQKPTILIPNLIDAQADRRFNSNESSGLKLVCDFLNRMSVKFKVFHPHNPEVVESLITNVEIIDNTHFISEVLMKISNTTSNIVVANGRLKENLILMSSDAGGFKPLMKLCDKINWQGEIYSATKSRKYEDGESKLMQIIDKEDFGGKDIIIIDDICVYGGTFKGLSKLLKERNCGKLYLATSHMTVQNLGEDPITNYFDKVFATNSKYETYRAENNGTYTPENLEIVKIF